MYFPKLRGELVSLSPIDPDDAPKYAAWLNDLSTTRYLLLATKQIGLGKEREILERLAGEHTYAIVENRTGELVGNVGLHDLSYPDSSAEIGIFIGPAEARGKGYGTEALRLLADYAFNALGVRNLMLKYFAFNAAGAACYRKVGFREIGRRRKARFWAGAWHDVVYMDLIAEDFGPSRLPPAG